MNKKEAKEHFLRKQLADPNISEWEKEQIRQRLGIFIVVEENDFTDKHGEELLKFVSHYLDNHLTRIRQQKRTNSPLTFLSENLNTMYYLVEYSSFFEQDTLEQIYDTNSEDDYKYLALGFEIIGRPNEATLVKSTLKKEKIAEKEIEKLQEHFLDTDIVTQEIEKAIEIFIKSNILEIIQLQTI